MPITVGLCGFGYWGPNLYRVFANNPGFKMLAVADHRFDRLKAHFFSRDGVRLFQSAEEMIDCPDIEALIIATPVAAHYELAARALKLGKPVLVEKPMCASVNEAADLVKIAESTGAILMVDHTFIFHGAVQKIKELSDAGDLGDISYYDSLRVNLGMFQPDVNVIWDLGPHDLSIIDYLFDEEPIHVEATGYCHLNQTLPDIAFVTLHFPSRIIAHLNLSWMSPVKARRVAIGGSKRMVVWNDLSPTARLNIYDSGITVHPEDTRDILIPSYRIGDVYSPRLSDKEPLAAVAEHFRSVINGTACSVMDGRKGLRIVSLLEQAQRSLDASLQATRRRTVPPVWPDVAPSDFAP